MNLTVRAWSPIGQLPKSPQINNNRRDSGLRFGAQNGSDPRRNPVVWIKAAAIVLGGTGAFWALTDGVKHLKRYQLREELKERREMEEGRYRFYDMKKKVVEPAYTGKALAKRPNDTFEIKGEFTTFSKGDPVTLGMKANWQIMPDSQMASHINLYMEQRAIPQDTQYMLKEDPYLTKATAKALLTEERARLAGARADGMIDRFWEDEIHPLVAKHANGFLKKYNHDALHNPTLQPALLERFKKDFFEGGVDFEGNLKPGIKAFLESQGVQLNDLQLEKLRTWDGKIIFNFAQAPAKTDAP